MCAFCLFIFCFALPCPAFAVLCGAVRCGAVRCGAVRCGAVQLLNDYLCIVHRPSKLCWIKNMPQRQLKSSTGWCWPLLTIPWCGSSIWHFTYTQQRLIKPELLPRGL